MSSRKEIRLPLNSERRLDDLRAIFNAVTMAMQYWPNSHLGDYTRLEDMHSAFKFIRVRVEQGYNIQSACLDLESDAYRHMDM
jgi:hypothetical protein